MSCSYKNNPDKRGSDKASRRREKKAGEQSRDGNFGPHQDDPAHTWLETREVWDSDDSDNGLMGVLSAEKTFYVCPFDACGRKYAFTSNLRRHMRYGHGLIKAGGQGVSQSNVGGSISLPRESDDIEGDDGQEFE